MIATGGLLRISARRQDSLRAKNRAENKRKRKEKKKRKNEVVVVKGKLKLFSVSGLVAAIGILVLLVGVAMAVLGYWPKESSLYPGLMNAQRTYDSRELVNVTGRPPWDLLDKDFRSYNGSNGPKLGAFAAFINRYLYSDKLKVFGPLIMGIGIFLFICGNAVLHENRDKKTKIINLRDIYSTVIDIHSLRSKESAPLNGFVNYGQSKDTKSSYGSPHKGSWPSPGSERHDADSLIPSRRPSTTIPRVSSLERQSFTDTVYSIYRDQNRIGKEWETRSIVSTSVNAFTLPMMKLNHRGASERRGSDKSGEAKREVLDAEAICRRLENLVASRTITKAKVEPHPKLAPDSVEVYRSSGSLQGAPRVSLQGSRVQLLPSGSPSRKATGSHLSLSALSDYSRSIDLDICPTTPTLVRSRRLSCPRLEGLGSGGYTKLEGLGGESFESTDNATFSRESSVEVLEKDRELHDETHRQECTMIRQYSKKQKLIMVSQSDTTLEDVEMDSVEV
ncbi:transmembrane protein 200C-like [Sinocyclocheilus grahami]|uniref:transmembrane protein 200C-like n=1 Tax=Sinocyclocheilus grahami TaxID=75366 RepID=UPI0007AC85A0|nr:PREDICTED: transmembrane protein 200C-like [Sinocyclocheilus grahami]XP_016098691.1 PREDICTED: transmembrane protein 200C-like [Sinocyclocheilus grahami]XP_016098692.1 PREDICTED: transmembrane protein 200C-like [Sinocyclocheilus grahami]